MCRGDMEEMRGEGGGQLGLGSTPRQASQAGCGVTEVAGAADADKVS